MSPPWRISLSHPASRRNLGIGLAIGITGALIGLLLTLAGPTVAIGALLGALAGLYVLTNLQAALQMLLAVLMLLPFGTLPFKLVITPTLLDVALGAFILVWLMQWMTGRRSSLHLTPVHLLIVLYVLWLLLSFALGLRFAAPTPNRLRQFAETLLAISMAFVLVDMLRRPAMLRRLVTLLVLLVGLQALTAVTLYVLPDDFSERALVRLARIGYPNGGVIRYIESNPALAERAIGTWVDPNLLGGTLAVTSTLVAAQLFATRPVLRWRWFTLAIFALSVAALFLTYSRASLLALCAGLLFIGLVRYRRFLAALPIVAAGVLALPWSRTWLERLVQAFTGADLATQMRLGEYGDALRLINRYPLTGVGFTGSPSIDLYTDVASMYLIMANQIGLVGVGLFLLMMAGLFMLGLRSWRRLRTNQELDAIHLGVHAALFTLLVNSVADMYFFRLDFQGSISLFWLLIGLALACSNLGYKRPLTAGEVTGSIDAKGNTTTFRFTHRPL